MTDTLNALKALAGSKIVQGVSAGIRDESRRKYGLPDTPGELTAQSDPVAFAQAAIQAAEQGGWRKWPYEQPEAGCCLRVTRTDEVVIDEYVYDTECGWYFVDAFDDDMEILWQPLPPLPKGE